MIIIAEPTANLKLYIPIKNMSPSKIKFPKYESNKNINNDGIMNIMIHKTIKNINNLANKSKFFFEKRLFKFIYIFIY
jgi:hypothetical protein